MQCAIENMGLGAARGRKMRESLEPCKARALHVPGLG